LTPHKSCTSSSSGIPLALWTCADKQQKLILLLTPVGVFGGTDTLVNAGKIVGEIAHRVIALFTTITQHQSTACIEVYPLYKNGAVLDSIIELSIIGDSLSPFPTLPPEGEGLGFPLPSGEGLREGVAATLLPIM
jgi:hypothetical protein